MLDGPRPQHRGCSPQGEAQHAAPWRSRLEAARRRRAPAARVGWIGHGAIVVTNTVKDFGRVKRLQVENWTQN